VKKRDFMQASSMLVPSSHRVAPCAGRISISIRRIT